MPRPNVFISHRWDYNTEYYSLIGKLDKYGLDHLDYSVPMHDPADVSTTNAIARALAEQVRQCNYFIIFGNRALVNSKWCLYELRIAQNYRKPILAVNPYGYLGGTPPQIAAADTEGGPVGLHAPAIIRRICTRLRYPVPYGL
jgi:hypothetical protein